MKVSYINETLSNPEFLQEGCLQPRATVVPALQKGVYFKNKEESQLIQVIGGDYKFAYCENDNLTDFYTLQYDDGCWDTIDVPSMWQYRGYSKPVYPNVEYPIPFNPPYVPAENPVGYYRKKFTAKKSGHSILYFGGVDNAYFVYLNGTYVGFSKGSRLPAEFDVTHLLVDGENLLCVKVFTYSDATYLENQDMLLTNGIFRDVMLFSLADTYVFDYHIRTDDTQILMDVTLEGTELDGISVVAEAAGQTITKPAEKHLSFAFTVDSPRRWNAEDPYQYDTYITLLKNGVVTEVHSKKIGFKTARTDGNRLLLNGTPITLKGVNRHEHNPHDGKAISVAFIEKELKNIKAHNFNAIRCSHYPNNPAFYEIASELGIYVMDEGDLETHGCCVVGDLGFLSKLPLWKKAFLNRTERMVERDKNETCVVIWSTGNEHGRGENINDCVRWIKARLGDVPVFDSDSYGEDSLCDFRGDGYMTMEHLMSHPVEGKPVILLEYGHAMGNSPGLMEDTWDYVYRNRHVIGGYVWEYKHHGFAVTDEKGQVFYQYGGDFDDYNHWSNFSMDGYCLSDGTPKPSLRDCKNVQSPCYVSFADGKIQILNTNDFKSLGYVKLCWEICEDYKVLRSGELMLPEIKPYCEQELDIDLSIPHKTPGAAYFANLRFYDGEFELANKQVLIHREEKAAFTSSKPKTAISADNRTIRIAGDSFKVEFTNGLISYYETEFDGARKVLIDKPMKLNFYRAPTDNDGVVNWQERWITKWNNIFLKHFQFYPISAEVTEEDDCILVEAKGKASPTARYVGFGITLRYRIYSGGVVLVSYEGKPFGRLTEVLPRIGVCFEMDREYNTVTWYGRGPEENYCDRKAHCNFGLYSQRVEDMNFLYDIPQECGNREETAFVMLSKEDAALTVIGSEQFAFSCHDFSLAALEKARHRNELVKSESKYLYIDYKMRGLGSHSCGPNPEECYELRPHAFRFAFALCGTQNTEEALCLARQSFCEKTEKCSDTYVFDETEQQVQMDNVVECNINR